MIKIFHKGTWSGSYLTLGGADQRIRYLFKSGLTELSLKITHLLLDENGMALYPVSTEYTVKKETWSQTYDRLCDGAM